MPINPTREDTYKVTVDIDGIPWGVWDKMSGGEVDSDESKYYPGGMEDPISLGGRRTTGNVTVSRLYRLVRDHDNAQKLINAVGKAAVKITKTVMDIDGHVYNPSSAIVYNGILKRVTFPTVDSESSTAGMVEIEVTIGGFPAQ